MSIVRLYGLRFKIELGFKQAVHALGAFNYHFWMAVMKRIKRRGGNQYMHHESAVYLVRDHRRYHRRNDRTCQRQARQPKNCRRCVCFPLGHESIETTLIYTKLTESAEKNASVLINTVIDELPVILDAKGET